MKGTMPYRISEFILSDNHQAAMVAASQAVGGGGFPQPTCGGKVVTWMMKHGTLGLDSVFNVFFFCFWIAKKLICSGS